MKTKKIVSTIIALALVCLWAMPLQAQEALLPSGLSEDEIGEKIEAFVAEHKATTAGLSVCVFKKERILYEGSFGWIDAENQIPVAQDSVFEWGSISKLTVWTAAMQLSEAGRLDLTADIRDYLPQHFVDQLKYEKPVTMIDLMNHKGGFEEVATNLMVKDKAELLPLPELLIADQPQQVFAPGSVTAYSNWSTALAAYVVECVAGEPYDDYVGEHIFAPLQMADTDFMLGGNDKNLDESAWRKTKNYNTKLKPMADTQLYIPLYPAGALAGTIGDLVRFGQAHLPGEDPTPFKKAITPQQLFTPTATHADGISPINAHGFWSLNYGVPVWGHGGNTAGQSSHLLLDRASGVGLAVMTNQRSERIYTFTLPELIFGPMQNKEEPIPKGFYVSARSVWKGPFKFQSSFVLPARFAGYAKLGGTHSIQETEALTRIVAPYWDLIRISGGTAIASLTAVSAIALSLLYGTGTLLINGIQMIIKKIKGTGDERDQKFKRFNALSTALLVLYPLNVITIVLQLMALKAIKSFYWQWLLNPVLILAMTIVMVWMVKNWRFQNLAGKKIRAFLNGVLMAGLIFSFFYWELYALWLL